MSTHKHKLQLNYYLLASFTFDLDGPRNTRVWKTGLQHEHLCRARTSTAMPGFMRSLECHASEPIGYLLPQGLP